MVPYLNGLRFKYLKYDIFKLEKASNFCKCVYFKQGFQGGWNSYCVSYFKIKQVVRSFIPTLLVSMVMFQSL